EQPVQQHDRPALPHPVQRELRTAVAGEEFGGQLGHSGTSSPAAFQRSATLGVWSSRWRGSARVSSHASCRLSAPACDTGRKIEGSSKSPTVRSIMQAPARKAKPSGVPQAEQNGRRAIGDEAYQSGSRSQTMASRATCTKAAATPPVAFWHIRQWQR
ncbi:hypothetical protein OY671_010450, partial [Metschnikowia pulcherrima]